MKRARLMDPGPEGRSDRQHLIGRRFGLLVVTEELGSRNAKRLVRTVCDCGRTHDVRANSLLSGNTKTCGPGCGIPKTRSHGHAARGKATRTYRIWTNMRARAAGQITPERYADRGITVCDRWLSFENFLADMGEAPAGLSLDREDNDGPYSPENCRWATTGEQARNRRNVTLHEIDGERLCAADWAARHGVSAQTLRARLRAGQSIHEALGALQ